MHPCPSCHRHLRASELACPFCGAAIRSTEAHSPSLLAAAFVGVFALIGCAGDPSGGDEEAGTTTSAGTDDESDTLGDEASTSEASTSDTIGDDTTTDTNTETSSSTSSSTSADSADTLDDNGGSFYAGPSGEEETWGSPYCDPWYQDCPEGEKCVPFDEFQTGSYTANKCVPVLGDNQPGEACTS
jgi:hypothetical protein